MAKTKAKTRANKKAKTRAKTRHHWIEHPCRGRAKVYRCSKCGLLSKLINRRSQSTNVRGTVAVPAYFDERSGYYVETRKLPRCTVPGRDGSRPTHKGRSRGK